MSEPRGLLGSLWEVAKIVEAERLDWDSAYAAYLDRRAPTLSNVIELDAWRKANEHTVG
jgi:hypothetical protein